MKAQGESPERFRKASGVKESLSMSITIFLFLCIIEIIFNLINKIYDKLMELFLQKIMRRCEFNLKEQKRILSFEQIQQIFFNNIFFIKIRGKTINYSNMLNPCSLKLFISMDKNFKTMKLTFLISMEEIDLIYDSFSCKICFLEYSLKHVPHQICSNYHIICQQCLQDISQSNPNPLCPYCKIGIRPNQCKPFKKLFDIKSALSKVSEKLKDMESAIQIFKQGVQFSQSQKNSCQILLERSNMQFQISKLSEQNKILSCELKQKTNIQKRQKAELTKRFNELVDKLNRTLEENKSLQAVNFTLMKDNSQITQKNRILQEQLQEKLYQCKFQGLACLQESIQELYKKFKLKSEWKTTKYSKKVVSKKNIGSQTSLSSEFKSRVKTSYKVKK